MDTPVLQMAVICAPLLIGFGASKLTARRIERRRTTPPSIVFGIVWTLVYVMLGVLLSRQVVPILRGGSRTAWQWSILGVLLAHLIATFAWTPTFATDRRAALYVLLFVVASALTLQALLINHDMLFVVLLAPYIAWLLFAMLMNFDAVREESPSSSHMRWPFSDYRRV